MLLVDLAKGGFHGTLGTIATSATEECNHDEDDEIQQDTNDILPFYPEIVFFKVFSIAVGSFLLMMHRSINIIKIFYIDGNLVLEYNGDGKFSVTHDSS